VLLLCCPALPAFADSVTIITSAEHGQQSLDRGFIQAAFTMRLRRWPDGAPLRVFVLPDADPTHARFSREQLGTYPYVLRSIWDRLVFTGTGFAPTVVDTEEEMSRRVRSTPGAIGYVRNPNAKEAPARVVPLQSEKSS
jgi:ABC-type phosphate transport system substrate-binding protein